MADENFINCNYSIYVARVLLLKLINSGSSQEIQKRVFSYFTRATYLLVIILRSAGAGNFFWPLSERGTASLRIIPHIIIVMAHEIYQVERMNKWTEREAHTCCLRKSSKATLPSSKPNRRVCCSVSFFV